MALLNEEQRNAVAERLSGGSPEEPSEPFASETAEAQPAAEAQEAPESPPEAEGDHPHQVPYNRFKEVIGARNELQGTLQEREQELLYMRARMDQMQEMYQQKESRPAPSYYQQDNQKDEFDMFSDDDDQGAPVEPQFEERFSHMEARLAEAEQASVSNELEREVAGALQQFPGVPEEVIYQAIAHDGHISATEAAQNYSSIVAEIEEAALARFAEGQRTKQAAPRTHSTSNYSAQSSEPPRETVNDMEHAREKLLEYLRK